MSGAGAGGVRVRDGTHLVAAAARRARWSSHLRGFDANAYEQRLAARGFRFLPRAAPAFPPLLRAIHDPPPGLFLRGAGELGAARRGRRSRSSAPAPAPATARRSRAARPRARARPALVVVSGLARGVDAEAHRGALDAGGPTVAVLGCGIDRDYPAAHAELARRIAATGCSSPSTRPASSRRRGGFRPATGSSPASAAATVVVEARERSGALITADLALEEGREVFAVPGEISSSLSAGTNALLKLGAAPLTAAADVLTFFGIEEPVPAERDALLDLLPATADELVRRTGRPAAEIARALVELELAGAASAHEGIYRVQ